MDSESEIKTSSYSKGRWKLYLSCICVYLAIIVCVQFYIIYNLNGEVGRYRPLSSSPEAVCEFYKAEQCCNENDENTSSPIHQVWKRAVSSGSPGLNGTCPAGCMPKKRRRIGSSTGRNEETRLIHSTSTPATNIPGYSWWYSQSYTPGTENSYTTYPSENAYTASYPSGNGYSSYPSGTGYSNGYNYPSGNGYTSYPSGNGLTGYSSWYGSSGSPGMPGPPGDPGWPGSPGEGGWSGSTGEVGMPGSPGWPGEAGYPGSPGEAGMPGSPGWPGEAGYPGSPGESGWPGSPGAVGWPGGPGLAGAPGMPGAAGLSGRPGAPGGMGARGPPGMPGGRGSPGYIGSSGLQGMPGSVGLPGVQGPAGNRGYPGVTFQNGYSGNNGYLGPSHSGGGGSYYSQGQYSGHRLTGRGDQTPTDEAFDAKPKNETEISEVLAELRLLDHPKCKDEVDHRALMQDLKNKGKVSFMILVDLADSVYCIVHA